MKLYHYLTMAAAAALLSVSALGAISFTERPAQSQQKPGPLAAKNKLGPTAPATVDVDINDIKPRPRNIMRANAMNPKGNIFAVIPTYQQASSYNDALYASIHLGSGTVTPIHKSPAFTIGEDYQFETAIVRGDICYVPSYSQDMVTSDARYFWKAFDLESGQQIAPVDFGTNSLSFCYSLTYDPYNDVFYGLSVNTGTGTMGDLVQITPGSWRLKSLDNVGSAEGDCMVAIAFNVADGNLYGLKDNGRFYEIDPKRGNISVVAEFDDWNDYFLFQGAQTPMPLVYDPVDHAFVTIYRDEADFDMKIAYIDCTDGEFVPVLGETLDKVVYVSALICQDQYADDDAPSLPEIASVDFDKAALSGSLTFYAPDVTYNEVAIKDPLHAIVKVDGSTVYDQTVKPGQEVTVKLSLSEGMHKAEVTCAIGDKTGPTASSRFYVGNDNPVAPEGLKMDGLSLKWNAVAPTGAHKGYVDPAAIAYNVYVDGELHNSAPVKTTSYTLTEPEKLGRRYVTVTAVANTKESEASKAVSAVIGKPMALPYSFKPTKEDFSLFTGIDDNYDGNEWKYYIHKANQLPYIAIGTEQYYQTPEDWLFFPAFKVEDTNVQYNLSFLYSNYFDHPSHFDSMEIYLCRKLSVDDAFDNGEIIYSHYGVKTPEDTQVSTNFVVPEPGAYFITIRCTDAPTGSYRGIKIRDIALASVAGSSVKAPGIPTDVTLTAAEKGEKKVKIAFKTPSKNLAGESLGSDKVTVEAVCGSHKATASVDPGQKGEILLDVDTDGFSNVMITPSNSFGRGISRSYSAYVGLDTPTAATNVRGIAGEDNMTYTLEWDAPTEGVNGGYIEPESLTYDILSHPTAVVYNKEGSSETTSFVYQCPEIQTPVALGVVAHNEVGKSQYSKFTYEYLGTPLELPMVEEFPSTANNYPLWKYSSEAQYSNIGWNVLRNLSGLNVGDGTVNQGVMMGTNLGQGTNIGRLLGPKVTTKGIRKAGVKIVYWDYSNAATMALQCRSSKQDEPVLIGQCVPERGAGKWGTFEVELPDWALDCGWVQFYIDVTIGSASNALFLMENFQVLQNYDYDYKVKSVTGTQTAAVGQTAVFNVVASNSGLEPVAGKLIVELFGDSRRLAAEEFAIGRTLAGRDFEKTASFPMLVEYLQYNKLEVKATAVCDNDEIASNNSRTVSIKLNDDELPVVKDLKAEWTDDDHKATVMTWSVPANTYGATVGFEHSPSFELTDRIANWKNIDRDGLVPFVFDLESMRWPGDDQPSAWVVYNAAELGTDNEPRLVPHSGSQYLLARSIAFVYPEDPIQNDDWLISPEVVGGSKVSFWMNCLDPSLTETIEIWTSSTTDDPKDFKKLRNFSKKGEETWEFLSFTLPSTAKYFAFVYRSWGQFGACIDDIEITPARLFEWPIHSYNVWRTVDSKTEKVADRITDLSFAESGLADKSTRYNVTVNVDDNGRMLESAMSNAATVWQTGVADLTASDASIAGGKGCITVKGHRGKDVAVYTADGIIAHFSRADSDLHSVKAAPGVYLVKVADTVAKVLVK